MIRCRDQTAILHGLFLVLVSDGNDHTVLSVDESPCQILLLIEHLQEHLRSVKIVVFRKRKYIGKPIHIQIDIQHIFQRLYKTRYDITFKHCHGFSIRLEILDNIQCQSFAQRLAAIIICHRLRKDPQGLFRSRFFQMYCRVGNLAAL